MTKTISHPLTPPDADLTDYPSMLLDVGRLRGSRLARRMSDSVFRCSVMSWSASWHQVPAGSLPDDDELLWELLEYRGLKAFQKVRAAGGLHGWVKCEADGRLYHPVVAEKVMTAIDQRLSLKNRTLPARNRRWAAKNGEIPHNGQAIDIAGPEISVTDSVPDMSHICDNLQVKVREVEVELRKKARLSPSPALDSVLASAGDPEPSPEPAQTMPPRQHGVRLSDPEWRFAEISGQASFDTACARRVAVVGTKGEDNYTIFKSCCSKVIVAARMNPKQSWDWETIAGWINEGFLAHEVILPAVKACAARRSYKQPLSLRYFDGAVRDYAALPRKEGIA